MYVDGAISDNYPVEYAMNRFGVATLGLYTNNNHRRVNAESMTLIEYLYQLATVSYRMGNNRALKYSHPLLYSVVVSVDVGLTTNFKIDTARHFELFSIGYQCGERTRNSSQSEVNKTEINQELEKVKEKVKRD
jgi:hypothetical protein